MTDLWFVAYSAPQHINLLFGVYCRRSPYIQYILSPESRNRNQGAFVCQGSDPFFFHLKWVRVSIYNSAPSMFARRVKRNRGGGGAVRIIWSTPFEFAAPLPGVYEAEHHQHAAGWGLKEKKMESCIVTCVRAPRGEDSSIRAIATFQNT